MSCRSTSIQVGFLQGDGVGLVRSLIEHGGEAEELTRRRLVDDDFLSVFIDRGYANSPETST